MTNNEVKNIIINKQMTYRDFANYFNLLTDDAIRIFQHLDLKKCSAGKNCVNPDGAVQSRQNFYNDKSKQDKLNAQCIYCQKQKDYQYHQNNEETCKQRARQHYHDNKEFYKQLNYQYYQDNKDYCNQQARQHYHDNKEFYKQKAHQYHQDNKDYCNQKARQHYHDNKEHCKQLNYQYYQNNKNILSQKNKEYCNSYAKFDTYNDQISYAEKTRHNPDNSELLQVKCAYCNQWFDPTNQQIQARIDALKQRGNASLGTENRFYCSNGCKQACPIYHRINYSKDDPNQSHIGTSREVQTELRQLVFERDNYICQKCNTHKDNLQAEISLHCHHIEGVRHEPIESADMDMCITVCEDCHKKIHRIPGCTYQDFQCKEEEIY